MSARAEQTRERLVVAAAREIERRGYFATDTNRIARAAGFAPATFYKHFEDKRAVFLAVYDDWSRRQWDELSVAFATRGKRARARAMIETVVRHHRAWANFRAHLRALVATDSTVRAHHRAARARQVDRTVTLLGGTRSEAVMLLLTVERVADALTDGEARALGLDEDIAIAVLTDRLYGALQ